MDHLIKQNIENLGDASVNRRKGNFPSEGIKKLKTFVKPLTDVKNIIEDKVNPEQLQKDTTALKRKSVPVKPEEDSIEELFFYSQYEDLYDDIIPKSLQLGEDDVSGLVGVFDYLPLEKCKKEHMEFLPELEFEMVFDDVEELCDVIKGLDSTSLLFDDLN